MAEVLADDLQRGVGRQQRRAEVPEVVQPDTGEARTPDDTREVMPRDVVLVQRPSIGLSERQAVVVPGPAAHGAATHAGRALETPRALGILLCKHRAEFLAQQRRGGPRPGAP